MDLNRQLDCSQARLLLENDGRLKQQQLHYETSMLHFLSKECFSLPSTSSLISEQQQLDSTFIVFPRTEYDLIKKDLQFIRQSFNDLRESISAEVQALKEESGLLQRQMERCRCVDADHQHLNHNDDQQRKNNNSQLWAQDASWENHRSAFTNLAMLADSGGMCQDSGGMCRESGGMCQDSGGMCQESGRMCRDSGVMCRDSGSLCSPDQQDDRNNDDQNVTNMHHMVSQTGNIFCSQNNVESHHQSSTISPMTVDSKQIQLLPNYDIYVNKLNLQIIINEGMSHKEGGALYVLRRLIPLVFTWDELACSRGQGLNCKTNDVNSSTKFPLDPTRVVACKTYMRKFCLEYGLPEPSERSINQTFSHQVNYARRRLRGVNESPRSKEQKHRCFNRKIKTELQDSKFMQM